MNKIFYVDLSGVDSPEFFQEALVRELPLPAHYGRNLDAFYDCLTEWGRDWNLIFYRAAALKRAKPQYFSALERLAAEAALATPGLRIRFFTS